MGNVKFELAGLFVSNGKGRHVTRTMKCHELIFVKSGVLHIREADRRFELNAGQFLILHKGLEHGGTADYKKDLSFFWGHFDCSAKFLKQCHSCGSSARADYFTRYFTLLVMFWVSLLIPFVVAYIAYAWRAMDRRKITREEMEKTRNKY